MSGPLHGQLGPLTLSGGLATYEHKILAQISGLMAYLPMTPNRWSEGASGILDVSGNGKHGTNNGATPNAVDGPSAAMGRAPSFDGNDYISLGSGVALGTTYTISIWVNFLLLTSVRTAVSFRNTINANAVVELGFSVGVFQFFVRDNGGGGALSTITSQSGFINLIGIRDGNTVTIYKNNVAGSPGTRSFIASSLDTYYVGASPGIGGTPSTFLNGYGFHHLVLDHAASAAERAIISSPTG